MASFDFCIDQAFSAGKISKATANELKASQDVEGTLNGMMLNLTQKKREGALQAARMAKAFGNMKSNKKGLYRGLVGLMTKDASAPYANVEYRSKFYQSKYHSALADALSRFRTRKLGFSQDVEGLEKMVRAIYGEAIDDADIRGFAKSWNETTEGIRKEFNLKGGSISKNEKWLLPQNHDFRAIQKVGLDRWKQKVIGMLDREQMTDDFGRALNDEQFDEVLDFVYETITTNGLNKAKDFSARAGVGRKMSRRGAEKRFLYFKDADSWLDYQREFGKGDIFTTLTDWVDTKAHDMALMEVFGPSPDNTFKALMQQAEKAGEITGRQKSFAEALYNVVSGKTNQGNLTGVADFFQTTRNLLTASTLGSAFISAISDVGFQVLTSKYNKIPAAKVLARHMSLMNPANELDRKAAVKMGLIAEEWLGRAQAANRYSDIYGTGWSTKVAEGVMRASLLQPWTEAGRKAFGMEFSSMLADNFGKSIGELDDAVRRAFTLYGIEEADWNAFRKTKTLDHKGAKFADLTKDDGGKFHKMIMSETDFAVPTPDSKVRAITTGGTGRATVAGQAWRSVMMLKSFPITIATTHLQRAAYQATTADKIAYTAFLAASTTILGGAALQFKDLAAGREPRPIDKKFIAAAFQQGGGFGIFGDFLFSDVNRFGQGPISTAFGPTGELIDTSLKLTLGNIREAVKGEETNVLGESAKFLKRYTPDVWQTRLFTDAVLDQIEIMANPSSQRRFNRIVKKRQAEYDQGYWWRPGEILPEGLK